MARSCLMIMADGAREDVFASLLADGRLPNISKHIVERGSYRKASSVFPSTTGPAHAPFLSGLYPGSADIPGIRWFDKAKMRHGQPLTALRSYCGVEAGRLDGDLTEEAVTLYESLSPSAQAFACLTRGADKNIFSKEKAALWIFGHLSGDYRPADSCAARAFTRVLDGRFGFVMYPGIDGHSHHYSPTDKKTLASYLRLDRAIGRLAIELRRRRRYQETLIMIVSDHGHLPVSGHFDVGPYLAGLGLRVAYHSGKAAVFNPDVVSCVSGNSMAHLYLPKVNQGKLEEMITDLLLARPEVDIVARRDEDRLRVFSRRGQAYLAEDEGKIHYRPLKGDPFGYQPLPAQMSQEQSLCLTFESQYPDGLTQLGQLLRSPRSGDLIVSARPGFDLRERFEGQEHRSGHGGLHRDHMLVPLLSSAPLRDEPMRTVDVYASVLDWCEQPLPELCDGRSRLLKAGL